MRSILHSFSVGAGSRIQEQFSVTNKNLDSIILVLGLSNGHGKVAAKPILKGQKDGRSRYFTFKKVKQNYCTTVPY